MASLLTWPRMLTFIAFNIIIPSQPSSTFNLIDLPPSSTFNLIHLHRPLRPHPPSTLPSIFDLQQSFHASSGLRPLAHTHFGTLAGCHTVQKDEEHMLGGLRVLPTQQSLASTVFVFPIPSRFWCRRIDALRSGPTSFSLLWFRTFIACCRCGGQELFVAGLPMFRFECWVDSVPWTEILPAGLLGLWQHW
jgi:hypothetical protein